MVPEPRFMRTTVKVFVLDYNHFQTLASQMGFVRDIHAYLFTSSGHIYLSTCIAEALVRMLPTLPSTPTLSPAELSGEPIMRRYRRETFLIPQDEDEREPMFIQAHDPDYVPESYIPEYVQLEDDMSSRHEEQPLPPMDSPTTESHGYGLVSRIRGGSKRWMRMGMRRHEEDERTEEPFSFGCSTVILITIRPDFSIFPSHRGKGERLARCMAPPAHSPPLPPSSGCLTQIQTLRIASTQALIDAVTAALPPPSLPPLPPSLPIPSPVDRRDDIPESEQPPRKRLHLSTICSKYEIGESSTARPVRGQGIDYGFVSTVDAEERRQGIRDVGYGIRDTWVDPAEAIPEIAPMTRMLRIMLASRDVWMVEEEAYASREAWAHSIGLSQATHQELQTHRDHVYAHETYLQAHQTQLQLQSTLIQTQHQGRFDVVEWTVKNLRSRGYAMTWKSSRNKVDKYLSLDSDTIYGIVKLPNPRHWMRTLSWPIDLMNQKLRTTRKGNLTNKKEDDDSS
ncbi:hypothetical protein Tco_1218492 [Tanacetum coccineum]